MEDNSQSSDVFSVASGCSQQQVPAVFMDVSTYHSLHSTTKAALGRNIEEDAQRGTFEAYFASILEDCYSCVCQSLNIITSTLAEPSVQCTTLSELVEDVAVLLQLMSSFLRKTLELSMSCRSLRGFPVITGQIMVTVFTHCKLSASVYGDHLGTLQTELKDLFRSCHELQLVYLTILEKHFLFHLSEEDERKMLFEALHINLKIGEIVEMLDLKTTAEQWKGYTALCEKYSEHLLDTPVFDNCMKTLSEMIMKNINTSLEENQDDKVVLRSLKVSNFIIKILMKMWHTFKNTSSDGHGTIVHLLVNIYVNHGSHLQYRRRGPQLVQMMTCNVLAVTDSLVAELVAARGFACAFLHYDINKIYKEEALLGYIILLASILRCLAQRNDGHASWMDVGEDDIVSCLFRLLPLCHAWFNLPLKVAASKCTRGLYEHLLTQAAGFCVTSDAGRYTRVEEALFGAVSGNDPWAAVFAGDLWVILASMANPELRIHQLIYLCQVYNKLERQTRFHTSPQKVHLSRLIETIFQTLDKDEKARIYRHFNIEGDDGGIWVVMKIKRLPSDQQRLAEEYVLSGVRDRLSQMISRGVEKNEMGSLITSMELASTCSFMKMDFIEDVISAWLLACPRSGRLTSLTGDLGRDNMWFLQYLTALVALTETMAPLLQRNSEGLMKVLHATSGIIASGNIESKLVSLNIIFKLALYNPDTAYRSRIDSLYYDIFKEMFRETNFIFRNKLFETIRTYSQNMRIKDIIAKVVVEEPVLDETWSRFQKDGVLGDSKMSLKEQFEITSEFRFSHKCLQSNSVIELTDSESSSNVQLVGRVASGNFDLVDLDNLFDNANEPACKKAKLANDDIEQLIDRLESDIAQLEKMKENLNIKDYRNRITTACEHLKSIMN